MGVEGGGRKGRDIPPRVNFLNFPLPRELAAPLPPAILTDGGRGDG